MVCYGRARFDMARFHLSLIYIQGELRYGRVGRGKVRIGLARQGFTNHIHLIQMMPTWFGELRSGRVWYG